MLPISVPAAVLVGRVALMMTPAQDKVHYSRAGSLSALLSHNARASLLIVLYVGLYCQSFKLYFRILYFVLFYSSCCVFHIRFIIVLFVLRRGCALKNESDQK